MNNVVNSLSAHRVLVAPLNWGLGHATRCVPIIRALIARGITPVIAVEGLSLHFLQQEFPNLEYVNFEGVRIRYSGSNSQVLSMARQIPKVLSAIRAEHRELNKIIENYNIDCVISDNRFGLWSSKVYSIYITHQMMIKAPRSIKWCEPLLWLCHRYFITRYNECWIPDYDDERTLAGDLAHKYPLPSNAKFIGPLSRFMSQESAFDSVLPVARVEWNTVKEVMPQFNLLEKYDNMISISGPEPHRSIMEAWAVRKYQSLPQKTLVVRGVPHDYESSAIHFGSVTVVPHLLSPLFLYYLQSSGNIICRAGYSSIMDLNILGRCATLIPTPGQTEQEYLSYRARSLGFCCLTKLED